MPLNLSSLIRQARDTHPTFDERAHPDPVLVRALSLFASELAGEAQRVQRNLVSVAHTVALPLADFAAGATLPAFDYPHGLSGFTAAGDEVPINLVSWELRKSPVPWPAATIHGGSLHLLGGEGDWKWATRLVFHYWPAPTELTSMSGIITLPDSAAPALVAHLRVVMARRNPKDAGTSAEEYRGERDQAISAWIDKLGQQNAAKTLTVHEVW